VAAAAARALIDELLLAPDPQHRPAGDSYDAERLYNFGLCAPPTGDLNCDGTINFGDINPFVQTLADPDGYVAAYPCAIFCRRLQRRRHS